ncbi:MULTISPECIES: chemotaxis protein CheW [Bacillus]|uniref:chemotaxis protein CheW n=1 Tax=Bacillus TaxID=1386 RepID=UPI000BB9375B|nr:MULTISPECIES: chemotaxis protein CheW [Bacillus]
MEALKLVTFETNGETYGIDVKFVISIEKVLPIHPVPHLPNYVLGITKVRNELIPVFDMKHMLFQTVTEKNEKARLIVVETEAFAASFLVEDAKEIIDVPAENMKLLSILTATPYLKGIAQLPNKLISIVEPTEMVSTFTNVSQIKDALVEQEV